MATKDWDLNNTTPKGKYWRWDNKTFGKVSITRFISWGDTVDKPFKNREPYFEVSIDHNSKLTEKRFKTKNEAMKFARAFMRKN